MNLEEKLETATYTLNWAIDALFGSSLSTEEICNSMQAALNKIQSCKIKTNKTVGVKLDENKPRMADMILCFQEVLPELCKVYEFGANKYGDENWKYVENGYKRFKNAMMRHFLSNRRYDQETGILETAHVAYNALMILWFELQERKSESKVSE